MLVAILAIGGLDIYLAVDGDKGNTYSEVIREWSYSFRWLPVLVAVAFGALLTHWFAKPYDREDTDPAIPSAKSAFRKRSRRERLIIAGAMLVTVAIGMGLGLWW